MKEFKTYFLYNFILKQTMDVLVNRIWIYFSFKRMVFMVIKMLCVGSSLSKICSSKMRQCHFFFNRQLLQAKLAQRY